MVVPRIFPLCVPSLSPSAEYRLLQLVHCYVSTSSADITVDEVDQCYTVYDASSLEDAHQRDGVDDEVDRCSQQPNQDRWTVDNGQ